MQTVGKLLGRSQYNSEPDHPELISASRLGVEVELEGFSQQDYAKCGKMRYWDIKEDQSLRNGGVEFVTSGGYGGSSLVSAFEELEAKLKEIEYNASWRCSTHMHINMLDCSLEQCLKTILAYMCVEPILFDFCDPCRRYSNFCVQLSTSGAVTRDMISGISPRTFGCATGNKYMALNVLPLHNHNLGTLEFRGSHALTTKDEMLGLANRLLSIREFAVNFSGTPDDMVSSIETGGWRQVLISGVPEGYQPDFMLFERCCISAWAALKRYQRSITEVHEYIDVPQPQPMNDAQRRQLYADTLARTAARGSTDSMRTYFGESVGVSSASDNTISRAIHSVIMDNNHFTSSLRAAYCNRAAEILLSRTDSLPSLRAWLENGGRSQRVKLLLNYMTPYFHIQHGALMSMYDRMFSALNGDVPASRSVDTLMDYLNNYGMDDTLLTKLTIKNPRSFTDIINRSMSGIYHACLEVCMKSSTVRLKNRAELVRVINQACGSEQPVTANDLVRITVGEAWMLFQVLGVTHKRYVMDDSLAQYAKWARFLTYQYTNGRFILRRKTNTPLGSIVDNAYEFSPTLRSMYAQPAVSRSMFTANAIPTNSATTTVDTVIISGSEENLSSSEEQVTYF